LQKIAKEIANSMDGMSREDKVRCFLSVLTEEYGTIFGLDAFMKRAETSLQVAVNRGVKYTITPVGAGGKAFCIVEYKSYSVVSPIFDDRIKATQYVERIAAMFIKGIAEFVIQEGIEDQILDEELIQFYEDESVEKFEEPIAIIREHSNKLQVNRELRKLDGTADQLSKLASSRGPVMDNSLVKFADVSTLIDMNLDSVEALGFLPTNPASQMLTQITESNAIKLGYHDLKTGFDLNKVQDVFGLKRKLRDTYAVIISDVKVGDKNGATSQSIALIPSIQMLMGASKADRHMICNVMPDTDDDLEIYKNLFEEFNLVSMKKIRIHNREIVMVLQRRKLGDCSSYEDFLQQCANHASRALRIEAIRMRYFNKRESPGLKFIQWLWQRPEYQLNLDKGALLLKELKSLRLPEEVTKVEITRGIDFVSKLIDYFTRNVQDPENAKNLFGIDQHSVEKLRKSKIMSVAREMARVEHPVRDLISKLRASSLLENYTINEICYVISKSIGNFTFFDKDNVKMLKIKN